MSGHESYYKPADTDQSPAIALGGLTAEQRERAEATRLIEQVMPYAADTFGIHGYENEGATDLQWTSFYKGGYTFGDHDGDPDMRRRFDPLLIPNTPWHFPPTDTAEVAMFMPLGDKQYQTVTVREVQKEVPSPTFFNRNRTVDKVVERQERREAGFTPRMCTNKTTGKTEPVVAFMYKFDNVRNRQRWSRMPAEESWDYMKSYGMGSMIIARVELPESVAGELLEYATTKDVGITRRLVGEMVQSSGILPKTAKFQAPPYSKLPSTWPIRIMTEERPANSILRIPKQQLAMPGPFLERDDIK